MIQLAKLFFFKHTAKTVILVTLDHFIKGLAAVYYLHPIIYLSNGLERTFPYHIK